MPAWVSTCISGYRRGPSPSPQPDRRHQVRPFAAEQAADPIRSPILQRVFDQILEHERCPCLDQAATFFNPADFDGRKAKAFRQLRNGRAGVLMVARDEYDPSTDTVGQWAGEDLERQLIEGLDQLC